MEKDQYRKPQTGMFDFFIKHMNDGVELDMDKSFFVGDAAGRPDKWAHGRRKDFASTDRKFAANVGLVFHTPEEFFRGDGKVEFELGFDPRVVVAQGEREDRPLHEPEDTPLAGQISTVNADADADDASGENQEDQGGDKTQEVVVFVGFPASGKSTLYRHHLEPAGYVHVNQDTLKTREKCVKYARQQLEDGRSVVIGISRMDFLK